MMCEDKADQKLAWTFMFKPEVISQALYYKNNAKYQLKIIQDTARYISKFSSYILKCDLKYLIYILQYP